MRQTAVIMLVACCLLVAGTCYGIGYTVFLRDHVDPMYTQVGDLLVLNPGDTPAYPATFRTMVCRPPNFSIYSSATENRLEVWEDYDGVALADDIVWACGPIYNPLNPTTTE